LKFAFCISKVINEIFFFFPFFTPNKKNRFLPLDWNFQTGFVLTIHLTISHHYGVAAANAVLAGDFFPVVIEPPLNGSTFRLMPEFPIKRLTRARAIIHHTADWTPPELVPPSLGSPATRMWTQSHTRTQRPAPNYKPLRQKLTRRMSLRRRHVATVITQQRTTRPGTQTESRVRYWEVPRHPRTLIARGGEHGGEFTRVGLQQKASTFRYVLLDAVTVLQTMTKLTQRVDMSEKSRACAQRDSGPEVLVVFCAAASVELYHGKRIQRRRVRIHSRLRHQRRAAPSVLQTIKPNLHADNIPRLKLSSNIIKKYIF